MHTQQKELQNRLYENGWELAQKETDCLDWWADEVWVLQSIWAPRDCTVYLTFLVDPMEPIERKKGEGVWAVSASLKEPVKDSRLLLTLGRGWEKRTSEFFRSIASLREQWEEP